MDLAVEEDALPLENYSGTCQSVNLRFVVFGRKLPHLEAIIMHMFPQIFPVLRGLRQSRGIALQADRQMAFDLPGQPAPEDSAVHSTVKISECCSPCWMASHRSGNRSLEVMYHPAFIDNTMRRYVSTPSRLEKCVGPSSVSLKRCYRSRGYRLGSYQGV